MNSRREGPMRVEAESSVKLLGSLFRWQSMLTGRMAFRTRGAYQWGT
jgi:hypothetical protein